MMTQPPSGVSLRPGESVLWTGQPYQGVFALQPLDAVLIPFSLFWAGFAFVWNAAVWFADSPIFFRLFGIPFLAMGIYITIGRFIHNKIIRSKMSYVLTNHRAFIVKNGSTTTVREVPLTPQLRFAKAIRKDGSGSIDFDSAGGNVLGRAFSDPKQAMQFWSGPGSGGDTFYRIENVEHVASLIESVIYPPQDATR